MLDLVRMNLGLTLGIRKGEFFLLHDDFVFSSRNSTETINSDARLSRYNHTEELKSKG